MTDYDVVIQNGTLYDGSGSAPRQADLGIRGGFITAISEPGTLTGDTTIDAKGLAVAPGFTHELKLRLRGLDCPEIATAAGRAAKAFVDDLLHAGDEVIMSTTKPDKYDRYLADVFIADAKAANSSSEPRADGSKLKADGSELFLNNALLQAGHAVPYDGVGPKDEAS